MTTTTTTTAATAATTAGTAATTAGTNPAAWTGTGPDAHRERAGQTTELLQALVRNACVNDGTVGSGQEIRSVRTLLDFLDGVDGLETEVVEPQPGRASLVARLRGTDPDAPS